MRNANCVWQEPCFPPKALSPFTSYKVFQGKALENPRKTPEKVAEQLRVFLTQSDIA